MTVEHRILVVDEDREFAELVCRRLVQLGYQVTMLHHARQAVQAALLRDYSVIVLSQGLPEAGGLDVLQLLASRVADLQAVVLTSGDDPGMRAAGDFTYLARPCRLAEIEAAIERAIECRAVCRLRQSRSTAHA